MLCADPGNERKGKVYRVGRYSQEIGGEERYNFGARLMSTTEKGVTLKRNLDKKRVSEEEL